MRLIVPYHPQLLIPLTALLLSCVIASDIGDDQNEGHGTTAQKLVYRPQESGQRPSRVHSIARGKSGDMPMLSVLVPNHTGLTIKDQPSLFWYQSKPCALRFELTLVVPDIAQPVLEFSLPRAEREGVQRLPLQDQNTTLSPGVEYQWTVALVPDEENRSQDIISSGTIKRLAPSPEFMSKIVKKTQEELVYLYAEEGLWYDALETVSELIVANPSAHFHELRAQLLEQADLPDVAAYDRTRRR